jgi:geranylgeranyl diphosphate synthase type II
VTREPETTLARYGALVRERIAAFLAGGSPGTYLYDLVRDYPARGGKAVRPALLLATCQALGGTLDAGLRPAMALELLHNAFLVHDDIEDGGALRRGLPTLHALHGVPLALNAGDALASLALQPLRDDPSLGPHVSRLLVAEFLDAVRQTTEGQALDLGWRRDAVADLGPADYLMLAGKKTAWYTAVAPLRMGAVVATRGAARLRALTRFGLHLGLAFQIRDDLLDLVADGGDLREGKRTLVLCHTFATLGPDDRAWLREHLATAPAQRPAGGDERVRELIDACGSVAFAREYARGVTAAAYAAFAEAFDGVPASEHLGFLHELVAYMTRRGE